MRPLVAINNKGLIHVRCECPISFEDVTESYYAQCPNCDEDLDKFETSLRKRPRPRMKHSVTYGWWIWVAGDGVSHSAASEEPNPTRDEAVDYYNNVYLKRTYWDAEQQIWSWNNGSN